MFSLDSSKMYAKEKDKCINTTEIARLEERIRTTEIRIYYFNLMKLITCMNVKMDNELILNVRFKEKIKKRKNLFRINVLLRKEIKRYLIHREIAIACIINCIILSKSLWLSICTNND